MAHESVANLAKSLEQFVTKLYDVNEKNTNLSKELLAKNPVNGAFNEVSEIENTTPSYSKNLAALPVADNGCLEQGNPSEKIGILNAQQNAATMKFKKAKRQHVPEEMKDDRYWARRKRNNIAAKRSREARRQREEQLEKRLNQLLAENAGLQQQLDFVKWHNFELRTKVAKLEREKYFGLAS